MAVITQTAIGFVWVVCAGALSDHVGRKNMDMIGAAFMGIFGLVYYAMLNTGHPLGDLRGNSHFAGAGDDAIRSGGGADR